MYLPHPRWRFLQCYDIKLASRRLCLAMVVCTVPIADPGTESCHKSTFHFPLSEQRMSPLYSSGNATRSLAVVIVGSCREEPTFMQGLTHSDEKIQSDPDVRRMSACRLGKLIDFVS